MQNTSPSKLEGPPLEPVTRKQLWLDAPMSTAPSVPASSRHHYSKVLSTRKPSQICFTFDHLVGAVPMGGPPHLSTYFSYYSGFTKRFILSSFTSAVVITLHKVLATTPRAVRMDWDGGCGMHDMHRERMQVSVKGMMKRAYTPYNLSRIPTLVSSPNAATYDSSLDFIENVTANRVRSNSFYNSPQNLTELSWFTYVKTRITLHHLSSDDVYPS
ncbi:hypothetical protein EV361DRAFT_946712 [Lentinula raphanica]|uniref:Uncharacterized protein n=1 Tax=Lentinula raphanica TaxID=153919 RepID=A0AA38P3U4_9AGAR|nr:hypothetical protein F5878DRAFT_663622 [Lentinula raphanica]KAJ3974766.1 hypothetical protein EV361DRAFT_946712 [Lentinula raphanica]